MSNIKTDNTATLVNALEEIERLQGRCAELEESLTELIQHYSETWDLPILQRAEAARDGSGHGWLLRKQAEAVEHALTMSVTWQEGYAKRLRQQADELEAGGGDE